MRAIKQSVSKTLYGIHGTSQLYHFPGKSAFSCSIFSFLSLHPEQLHFLSAFKPNQSILLCSIEFHCWWPVDHPQHAGPGLMLLGRKYSPALEEI